MSLLLVTAVALMDSENRFLLTERSAGRDMAGLWEFPGGKVEAGETPEEALARELREELALTIDPEDLTPLTFASHAYPRFHLLMPLFLCRKWQGTPTPLEGQRLVWVDIDNFGKYEMPPADIPLARALSFWFGEKN